MGYGDQRQDEDKRSGFRASRILTVSSGKPIGDARRTVSGDGLMAVQQVMKCRGIRALEMAALHWLIELLRIA
jgi:hypothetical protein